jgi:thioredoxin-like negative regulator of GroEL
MNLQETIRRILREETEIPLFLRRRFSPEDLEWLVNDVKEMIDDGQITKLSQIIKVIEKASKVEPKKEVDEIKKDEIGKADILSGELYKLKGKIQDAFFDKIRKFINMGSYEDAEYLLNRVKGQMKEKSLAEIIAKKLKSK